MLILHGTTLTSNFCNARGRLAQTYNNNYHYYYVVQQRLREAQSLPPRIWRSKQSSRLKPANNNDGRFVTSCFKVSRWEGKSFARTIWTERTEGERASLLNSTLDAFIQKDKISSLVAIYLIYRRKCKGIEIKGKRVERDDPTADFIYLLSIENYY